MGGSLGYFRKFVSDRTDNVIIGAGQWVSVEEGEGPRTTPKKQGVLSFFSRFFGDWNRDVQSRMFRKKGDRCCFIACSVVLLYLIFSVLVWRLFVQDIALDLDSLPAMIHARHDSSGGVKSVSFGIASLLSLARYDDSDRLPGILNTKCRHLKPNEIMRGLTFSGTSLPILMEVMCQVLHQDTGCEGNPRAISPRLVNVSLFVEKFIENSGRRLRRGDFIDTTHPSVISEMNRFADITFEYAPMSPGNDDVGTYVLEDVCMITYKDEKGLCYHYLNPQTKSLKGFRPLSANINGEGEKKGKNLLGSTMAVVSSTISAITSSATQEYSSKKNKEGRRIESDQDSIQQRTGVFFYDQLLLDRVDESGGIDPYDYTGNSVSKLVTLTNQFFPFLGKHSVEVSTPIIFQYQPLIDDEFRYAERIDAVVKSKDRDGKKGVSKKKSNEQTKGVPEEELKRAIHDYEEAVASRLSHRDEGRGWLVYLPRDATIAFPPEARGLQLLLTTQILDGMYLSPSLFNNPLMEDIEEIEAIDNTVDPINTKMEI